MENIEGYGRITVLIRLEDLNAQEERVELDLAPDSSLFRHLFSQSPRYLPLLMPR
jgi:hypothetical protein